MTQTLSLSFYAALTDKGATVSFYDDGRGRIVLETDTQQLPEIMKLLAYGRRKPLRVNIVIENPANG